jgi:hypothetical protein
MMPVPHLTTSIISLHKREFARHPVQARMLSPTLKISPVSTNAAHLSSPISQIRAVSMHAQPLALSSLSQAKSRFALVHVPMRNHSPMPRISHAYHSVVTHSTPI